MPSVVKAERALLDGDEVQQALRQMAADILALPWPRDAALGPDARPRPWLVGIHRGGVQVARELAEIVAQNQGWRPAVGTLDITLYRDDTWLKGPHAVEASTRLPGDANGQRIVLCDDVLFTGRTVRAALSLLLDFGRPEAVRLAVLLDRGGRELPMAADVVGRQVQVGVDESVELRYEPDGRIAQVHVERRK